MTNFIVVLHDTFLANFSSVVSEIGAILELASILVYPR